MGRPPALLAALLLAVSCSEAPRPNVLLISIDTLRADHLSTYGYPRETAPNIRRLADAGAVFEDCAAAANWTLPSHASILTGLSTVLHKVDSPNDRLGEQRATLAETLARAGYQTAGYVSNPFLDERFGYARGFDDYRFPVERRVEEAGEAAGSVSGFRPTVPFVRDEPYHVDQTSPDITALGLDFLEQRDPSRPFFLFLHFNDVHDDYIPPEPHDRQFLPDYDGALDVEDVARNGAIHAGMAPRDLEWLVALYDGEIAWVDRHVGEVLDRLDALGLADDTLVVLTSDHGEGFFEHGEKGHQYPLYAELAHVPWILRLPGRVPAGRRIAGPVGQVDIAPTILGLVGVAGLPEADGVSWADELDSARVSRPLDAPMLSSGELLRADKAPGALVTRLATDDVVVIGRRAPGAQGTHYEVFDARKDPRNTRPLSPDHAAWRPAVELLAETLELSRARADALPGADGEGALPDDPELLEQMRQWGYVR